MSHFSKNEASKKNTIIFMMLAFSLLFNVAVWGQIAMEKNSIDAIIESKPLNVENNQVNKMSSNINLIFWFMGSKQNLDTTILPIDTTGKRQLRTSGTVLNKLLIKTFMKKATNYESVVV